MTETWTRGDYSISTDRSRLDVEIVHAYLANESYWAQGRSHELMDRAIAGSLAFGLYRGEDQAGFARVVTDYASFAYLADVFVLEAHRGRGLGKFLVATVLAYPPLRSCGWTLFTKDAHELYRQYGFAPPEWPERLMRRKSLEILPL